MSFDNLVHTAPFPDFTKSDMNIKPPLGLNTPSMLRFTKKLGNHRGNPRIFFETTDIQPFGFVPGAKYDMGLHDHEHLELAINEKGKRAVCKRVKPTVDIKVVVVGGKATITKPFGQRVLSVIDINSQVLEGFRDDAEVLVEVTYNHIIITKLPKE